MNTADGFSLVTTVTGESDIPKEPLREREITRLAFRKNASTAVDLWLDNEKTMTCHIDLVLSYRLEKGMRLSADTLASLEKDQKALDGWLDALRFIHLRPRTRREIEKRLAQKDHDTEVIEDIIRRLTSDYGLNDAEVARDYISHRQNRMGERRLRQELSQRGVAREVIDAVMASEDPAMRRDEEFDNALDLARRKVSQSEGVELRKVGLRVVGLLERRGYGADIIRRVLDALELKLY